MATVILLLLFFLGFIVIPLGITFLLYWIPKRLGYPKLGKILAGTLIGLLLLYVLYFAFEDYLFFKSDARKSLSEHGIVLLDDFKILRNENMTAIGDYYHVFTLKISANDKKRLIDQFKHAPGYKGFVAEDYHRLYTLDKYEGNEVIEYSEDEYGYKRESCKPMGKDYAPLLIIITIDKKDNTLTFEDIDG